MRAAMRPGRRVRVLGEQPLRERLERVARQDRAGFPEDGPRGRPVPARGVPVHDVVVQEREVVDEFHGRRRPYRELRSAPQRPYRREDERRLMALPACPAAVVPSACSHPKW